MAFTDYGLGLGLAYRHDFEAADRFKLAAIEMGERNKERLFREKEAGLAREERERERQANSNRFINSQLEQPDIEGEFWNEAYRKAIEPHLKEIADMASDPNWELDMANFAKINNVKRLMTNHPIVKKQIEVNDQYALAKKEYESGLIDQGEFLVESNKYQSFLKYGTDYTYDSRNAALEERFKNTFGQFQVSEDFFGSAEEASFANEFYAENEALINRKWSTLPEPERKLWGSPKKWVLEKSRLYTGAEKVKDNASKGGGGSSTEKERLWNAALAKYREDFIDIQPPPGTDPDRYIFINDEAKNFIALNDSGAYNRNKVVVFDDSGEEVKMDVIDTPDNGLYPIPRQTGRFRKYNDQIYVETTFRVPLNPDKEIIPETKPEKQGWFGGTKDVKTGNVIVASEAYKQFKAHGVVTDENFKTEDPYYVVKAWAPFNPGRKEIIKYYDESYGEDQYGFIVANDDEVPTE